MEPQLIDFDVTFTDGTTSRVSVEERAFPGERSQYVTPGAPPALSPERAASKWAAHQLALRSEDGDHATGIASIRRASAEGLKAELAAARDEGAACYGWLSSPPSLRSAGVVLDVAPVATSGVAILRVGGEEIAVDISALRPTAPGPYLDGIVALAPETLAHWRRAYDLAGVVSLESLRATASPDDGGGST